MKMSAFYSIDEHACGHVTLRPSGIHSLAVLPIPIEGISDVVHVRDRLYARPGRFVVPAKCHSLNPGYARYYDRNKDMRAIQSPVKRARYLLLQHWAIRDEPFLLTLGAVAAS